MVNLSVLYPPSPGRFPGVSVASQVVLDHLQEYAETKRIFVAGQSAGAWLTLMLAFDTHYLRDAGVDLNRIAGFVSDSSQITTHFSVLRERGCLYLL